MPSCSYAMVLRKCFWKVVSAAAHIQMNEWVSPFPKQLQRVDGGQGEVCIGAVSDPAPPLCTPIGREVIGGDGASGCTSRLHPLPPREAVVTRCYMQPRHLHAITSALHALVPFPRVLLKGGGEGGAAGGTLSFREAFASPRTDHNRSD